MKHVLLLQILQISGEEKDVNILHMVDVSLAHLHILNILLAVQKPLWIV